MMMTETQKLLLRAPILNYYNCSRKNYFFFTDYRFDPMHFFNIRGKYKAHDK